jgi:hypothetical protein
VRVMAWADARDASEAKAAEAKRAGDAEERWRERW